MPVRKVDITHESIQRLYLTLTPFNRAAMCSSCGVACNGGGLCVSCQALRDSWAHTKSREERR